MASDKAPKYDPLKIYYVVTLATDDPRNVTPFEGFSISWPTVLWVLELLALMPADVLERALNIEEVIALRMGGVRPLAWSPLGIKYLSDISADQLGIFLVLFSGEKSCAEAVSAWIKKQNRPVLHITSQQIEGACRVEDFTIEVLRTYCIEALKNSRGAFSDEQWEAAEAALVKWTDPPITASGLTEKGHNITRPNYMVLLRAARPIEKGDPFVGASEQEYANVIVESARAVVDVRKQVGLYGFHYMTLLRPELILVEPAFYRPRYKAIKPEGVFKDKILGKTLRRLQTQPV